MIVRIQVIKVYDIDVPDNCPDPILYAYDMQTVDIERLGRFVDVTTDNVETLDEVERDAVEFFSRSGKAPQP